MIQFQLKDKPSQMKLAPYFKVPNSHTECDKYRWAEDVPWGTSCKIDRSNIQLIFFSNTDAIKMQTV